ncbi:MAG: type II toxin-antitoxin system VapC family toxin [Chloroflexi bacterium]|nr:type II toxin-antitoxin system VapC family toxin [Chloroflexota bacterium]
MSQQRFVLDSFALIAFFESAKGGIAVRRLLEQASRAECELLMSIINVGEVLYITEREQGLVEAQDVLALIDALPIRILHADRAQTLAAARIKAQWPLSYADCFAAALAKLNGAAVVTGDPEFKQLEVASIVPISWLPTA